MGLYILRYYGDVLRFAFAFTYISCNLRNLLQRTQVGICEVDATKCFVSGDYHSNLYDDGITQSGLIKHICIFHGQRIISIIADSNMIVFDVF